MRDSAPGTRRGARPARGVLLSVILCFCARVRARAMRSLSSPAVQPGSSLYRGGQIDDPTPPSPFLVMVSPVVPPSCLCRVRPCWVVSFWSHPVGLHYACCRRRPPVAPTVATMSLHVRLSSLTPRPTVIAARLLHVLLHACWCGPGGPPRP